MSVPWASATPSQTMAMQSLWSLDEELFDAMAPSREPSDADIAEVERLLSVGTDWDEHPDQVSAAVAIIDACQLGRAPVLIYAPFLNVELSPGGSHKSLPVFNSNLDSRTMGELADYSGSFNLVDLLGKGRTSVPADVKSFLFYPGGHNEGKLRLACGDSKDLQIAYDHLGKQIIAKLAQHAPAHLCVAVDRAHTNGVLGACDMAVLSPFLCTDEKLYTIWLGCEIKTGTRFRPEAPSHYNRVHHVVLRDLVPSKRPHLLLAVVYDKIPEALDSTIFYNSDDSDLFDALKRSGLSVLVIDYHTLFRRKWTGDLSVDDKGEAQINLNPELHPWVETSFCDHTNMKSVAGALWDQVELQRGNLCHRGDNSTTDIFSQNL